MRMEHIKQFPHCDPRILHAPGQCEFCDKYPVWQELREMWRIAFTGETPVELRGVGQNHDGPVLPCPADYTRGNSHTKWTGNLPFKVVKDTTIPRGQIRVMLDGKLIQIINTEEPAPYAQVIQPL